jgi:hypothetical protein
LGDRAVGYIVKWGKWGEDGGGEVRMWLNEVGRRGEGEKERGGKQ